MSTTLPNLSQQSVAPAQTAGNRMAANAQAVVTHRLPAWMFALFIAILALIAIVSHAYKEPVAINMLLGVGFLACMALLYSFESGPNHVGIVETFVGLCILGTGILIGSSPSAQPGLTKFWKASGLAPTLKLEDGPNETMWSLKDDASKPSEYVVVKPNNVPDEFQLVVKVDNKTLFVTKKGVQIGRGKEAEVWLQERTTGLTGPSIPLNIPAASPTSEKVSPPSKAPETPSDDSAPIGEEPKPPTPATAPPATDPPPADTDVGDRA